MSNPRMQCIILPLAGEQAAQSAGAWIAGHKAELHDQFAALPAVHFASLSLLPPLPGVAGALPALMLEVAVDEGIDQKALVSLLLSRGPGIFAPLLAACGIGLPGGPAEMLAEIRRRLLGHCDPAAGGFVGVRDFSRAEIEHAHALFMKARDLFTPGAAAPAVPAGQAVDGPGDPVQAAMDLVDRACPGPVPAQRRRSLWRRPWMSRPLKAFAIAGLLVAGPVRAAGFGVTGLLASVCVSLLTLLVGLAAFMLLGPALLVALLGVLSSATAATVALLAIPPYLGVIPVAALALLLAPIGFALFGAALTASLAKAGTVQRFMTLAAGVGAAALAVMQLAGVPIRRLLAALRDFAALGSRDCFRILAGPGLSATIAAAVPAAMVILAAALVATFFAGVLSPLIVFAGTGIVVAWIVARTRSGSISVTFLIVALAVAALLYLDKERAASWPGERFSLLDIAPAAVVAAIACASIAILAYLFGKWNKTRPLLSSIVATALILALGWLTLPHLPPGGHAGVATGGTKTVAAYGQFLVVPSTIWLTLAGAAYFNWRIGSTIGALAAFFLGMAGAKLAPFFASSPVLAHIAAEAPVPLAGISVGMLLVGAGGKRIRDAGKREPRVLAGMGCAWLAVVAGVVGGAALLARADSPGPLVPGCIAGGLLVSVVLLCTLRTLVGAVLALSFIGGAAWYGANYNAASPWLVTLDVATAFAACMAVFIAGASGFRMIFGSMNTRDLASFVGSAVVLLLAVLVLGANCFPGTAHSCAPVLTWVARAVQSDLNAALLVVLLSLGILYAIGAISESLGAVALLSAGLVIAVPVATLGVGYGILAAALPLLDKDYSGILFYGTLNVPIAVSWVAEFDHALAILKLALLLTAPFAALAVLAAAFMMARAPLSWLERAGAPVNAELQATRQTHPSILACEAGLANRMQHMISVTEIRQPAWFFAPILRYVLWVVNTVGHIWCTDGRLGDAPGIHFGHWHVIDNGRRLVFCSNFEVPFGGYLDDFIRGARNGVNLVWRCTELPLRNPACEGHPGVTLARSFPPTAFGILGGCANEQWFKTYARESMIPHLFRFEAYSDSYNDIARAARFCDALRAIRAAGALGERPSPLALDQIVRALES